MQQSPKTSELLEKAGIGLCGGAVALCLFLLGALISLIVSQGFLPFWPEHLVELNLKDGSKRLVEKIAEENCNAANPEVRASCKYKFKQANRELFGEDYVWIEERELAGILPAPEAVVVQRSEWGKFFAYQEKLPSGELLFKAADGREPLTKPEQILSVYSPNKLNFFSKLGHFLKSLWLFLSTDPREANTEGGIFPAIFGTVVMVLLMSVIVTPFGVVAAIYLREYAKDGIIINAIRIAVNNLAGVPSVVFGVFGLSFFVYGVGGSIDRLFFSESLPAPTFGTGGLLWASLTLALLTVPTVIVTAEEGLAALPKDLREGSYALGATKFETIWKVVLPSLLPSILTGMILSIARAAGEVAPLMLTGVVKLAPALPLDASYPYLHLDRKFMHLGFHIFDVGFQSPNVDAAKPMVYATAFLLIVIVVALNLIAMIVRNRLRNRYRSSI